MRRGAIVMTSVRVPIDFMLDIHCFDEKSQDPFASYSSPLTVTHVIEVRYRA